MWKRFQPRNRYCKSSIFAKVRSSSTDHRPLYHISLHISTQDIPKHLNSTDPVSELTALNLAILNTLWLPDVEIRCRGGIYLTSRWCCISRDTSGISRQNSCLESFNSTENLLLFKPLNWQLIRSMARGLEKGDPICIPGCSPDVFQEQLN